MTDLDPGTMTDKQAEEWVVRLAAAGKCVFLSQDGRVMQVGWLNIQAPTKAVYRAIQAGRLKHAFSTPEGWSTGSGNYFVYVSAHPGFAA